MEVLNQENQRYNRTDKLIMSAFVKLLEKYPLTKISVKDICDEAMIKRATFYNHFESKEQLLLVVFDNLKEELYQSIIDNSDNYLLNDFFYKIAEKTVDFVSKHREKIAIAIKNINSDAYNMLILESINRSIKYIIAHSKDKLKVDIPIELVSRFYSGGFANLVMWWITTDNTYTKEDLLNEFEKFMPNIIFN